jgi:hypothetical protein
MHDAEVTGRVSWSQQSVAEQAVQPQQDPVFTTNPALPDVVLSDWVPSVTLSSDTILYDGQVWRAQDQTAPTNQADLFLAALPTDATYLVTDYRVEFNEWSFNDRCWFGRVTLAVNQPYGLMRIRCDSRQSDQMVGGQYFSYEAVRNLLEANIAANRTVTITLEPYDLHRWTEDTLRLGFLSVDEARQQLRVQGRTQVQRPEKQSQLPEDKARELLWSWLTKEQRHQFKKSHCFDVIGNATGTCYRIHKATVNNIEVIYEGKPSGTLCVVPRPEGSSYAGSWMPIHDVMLAQKVALETDELETLRRANPGGDGDCIARVLVCMASYSRKHGDIIKRFAQLAEGDRP